MTKTIIARRIARQAAEAHANCPVEIIAGDAAPKMCGESYHWETMGGRRIYHPSAYARSGWSNMRYVSSTLRVEVGMEWLIARGLAAGPMPPVAAVAMAA